MYPVIEQFQRLSSISIDDMEITNSIHGSVELQQNVNSMSHNQKDITTQSPTIPNYNDNKLMESISNARIYVYRGEKIAGFELQGIRMICLPQAYEMFLKNVISGLHTVHTKLKRLQIRLVICNVEQVRALRNLGAIQKAVNRCKLISCNDFDQLYNDCYKIQHRSGRLTKRPAECENTSNDKSKKQKYTSDRILIPFTTKQQIRQLMATVTTAITSQSLQSKENTIDTTFPDHKSDSSISLPSIPLNLTKNVDNHQNESDSNNASEKGISSHNSKFIQICSRSKCINQDESTEDTNILQVMLSKLITLIEMAMVNLKTERELVENEKSLLCKVQRDLEYKQSEYDKIQRELSMEQQKIKNYFRRYCKAKRESLKLKEKLINLSDSISTKTKLE
ncbi:SKI/SNO/DAC family protein [Brugia pahangi]